jgi:DNA polymerase-3 subunit gamma/tau
MRELRGYGLTWQDMEAIYGRPGSGRAGAWAGVSPAPAPSPAPAQAPAAAPPPAQPPAQYLPAGWATRNAAADIEAATAPTASRDFETFGPGGPVLKDTTPSSSPSSPSSGAGLGLIGLLAFLFWS